MKKIRFILASVAFFAVSCSQSDPAIQKPDEFTGSEVTYTLVSGGIYNLTGTVVFKERKDGFTSVFITVNGLKDGDKLEFPAHLHFGDISVDNADLAKTLNSVKGSTGKSETILKNLEDGTPITYDQMKNFEGCVKIHLAASGPEKDIILAAGNVGSSTFDATGRYGIGVCKSE